MKIWAARCRLNSRMSAQDIKREGIMDRIDRIVAKNTHDGVIDWEAVEVKVNESINGIVAKDTEKAIAKYLADKGFKDEKAFADHLAEHETLKTTHAELTAKQEKMLRDTSLLELGITDAEKRDYLAYTIGKKVDDKTDWTKALAIYQEEKPELFATKPITSGTKVVPPGATTEKMGFEKILEEKHPGIKL